MSNRYFVRTVNPKTPMEHFVVADFHREGACMNVYFNRPAAIEEARWLNRYHHRQRLKDARFEWQHDFHSPRELHPQIEPTEGSFEERESDCPSRSSKATTQAGKPEDSLSRRGSQPRKTAEQVMKSLMKRRLVN
ncbi:hypothetical protein F0A16_15140 [Salinicola corii]|uniref:Uncharacterized protein n=1 Tax=Salinicola corii TaxID=2606937 RepID=A0A640W999_9GAMM|nr:hypothetical protein [Salinicola corii]KAA0016833.1 hypothetical protein F0A16_15140 [Salinicola corii]